MSWYKKISMKVMAPREFKSRLKDFGVMEVPAKNGVGLINTTNDKRTNFHQESKRDDIRRGVQSRILSDLGIDAVTFYASRSKKKKLKPLPVQEVKEPKKEEIPSWKLQPWAIEQQQRTQPEIASSHNWFKRAGKDLPGGLADKKKPSDFDSKQLEVGVKVELEHTNDKQLSKDIAMDHLEEFPAYYTELDKMEKKLEEKK